MNTTSTIACPACGNPIPFDIYGLLAGRKFCCSRCSAALGLSSESYGIVSSTMQKFEALKARVGR
jgi:endogenous inhibitor of DNA gyrase (YacG/DUF329 family)